MRRDITSDRISSIPQSFIVSREIEIRGSFRFHREFALAADCLNAGRIDVSLLLTATLPLEEAVAAFELASDRRRAMKIQIGF